MNDNIFSGNPTLLGRDWFRERMRQQLEPIRGTKIAVVPQSNNAKICGRSLDESVMVGGFGGLPIVDGSVGVGALGGTAYAAPTWSGGVTITTSSTALSVDVVTQTTLNNVPQDGNCTGILWVFRRYGQSTWTPWAETPLSGLPTPPASQVQSFGYGNLTSGLAYDFGCCYVAANGALGAIAVLASNYAVPPVGIPSSYMLGGTTVTPTFSGVTDALGTSGNGISTPCTLNWTCTNQPTDGSLSRVSLWIRQNGTPNWTFYASLQAVGVNSSTPPASAAYAFTFTDLTNGLTYDFGLSYENAQGGEGNIAAIVSAIAMPSVGPPATAKMPSALLTSGPHISSDTIGGWTNAGTANPSLPAGVTFSDWTTTLPAWLLGVRFYIRNHGTTSPQSVGDQTVPSGTNTINVTIGPNAGATIDIGCSYLDNSGQESTIAWPGGAWNNIAVPAIGPNGIYSLGGPNLIPDSQFAYGNFNGSGIASNDPYWNFYLIDGASCFLGRGATASGSNYFGIRPGDSNKTCKAQSEVIPVAPNTLYTVSCYIDATTCSGANLPYIAIVSTDQSVEYVRASQTLGKNGVVSAQYTTPASGGPTQVTVLLNSNNTTINSSILVFQEPMLQTGNLGPYTPGGAVSGGVPSGTGNNPPPAGGSGGGAADPGAGSGDGGGYHKNKTMSYQVRGVVSDSIDTFGSYVKVGSIHRLHLEQSGQPGGTNLIYNPTFANGTTGWNRNIPGSSQVLGVSTDTFGGGRLNLTGATMANGAYDGFFQSINLPFTGQTMMCSGILEAAAVSGVSYNVEVLNASQGTLLGNFVFDNTKGSGRQPFAFRCDNGSNGTIVVRFYTHNTSGASVNVGTMTVYKLQIEYGTTPSPFVDHNATAGFTKTFDANNALLASSLMNTRVPNSTMFRHNANIWVSWPANATSLTYYIDDGGGSGTAPTFWRPDNSNFASSGIGNWNAKTGGVSVSGLTANSTVYMCAYYIPGDTTGVNGTGWHVTVQQNAFAINSTPIAQAYADGGYMAVQASTGSSASIAAGTSGGVVKGGGGGGRMMN